MKSGMQLVTALKILADSPITPISEIFPSNFAVVAYTYNVAPF
jgi:hypothetical protein